MLASAAVAPFAFLAYTASLYAFGEGAIDEFGEQYPFPVMAGLSLLASGIYVGPALIIWVLLREGYHQKPAVPTIPSSPSRYMPVMRSPRRRLTNTTTPHTSAVTAAPGWYRDPGDPGRRRFWDGAAWTDQTATAEEAPHHTA